MIRHEYPLSGFFIIILLKVINNCVVVAAALGVHDAGLFDHNHWLQLHLENGAGLVLILDGHVQLRRADHLRGWHARGDAAVLAQLLSAHALLELLHSLVVVGRPLVGHRLLRVLLLLLPFKLFLL